MNNEKLNKKIADIKLEIEDLVSKINEERFDDDSSTNLFSVESHEIITEENSVINSSLDFLDQENEKLFIKIEKLKNEVNESLKKLSSENSFMDIIEKFAKIYGIENINPEYLNKFFNIENKYVKESNFISNEQIEKIQNKEDQLPKNNIIGEMQQLFLNELSKIENINNNKEQFISDNISSQNLTDEQKLFDLFSKIDEMKFDFSNNMKKVYINYPLIDAKNREYDNLLDSLTSTINKSYDELKKQLTENISWKTFLKDLPEKSAILESSKDDNKENNYENVDQKINDLELKVKLAKSKYDLNDYSLDSFNSYLLFNKIDNDSLQKTLDSMYLDCIENFVENLKNKKDELEHTNSNYKMLVNSVAETLANKMNHANDVLRQQTKNEDELSNNNFFIQKSVELLDKIKSVFNETLSYQKDTITSLLSSISIGSLKKNKENFAGLISSINESRNEFNLSISKLVKNIRDDLAKILEINTQNFDSLKEDLAFEVEESIKQLYSLENEFNEPVSLLERIEKEYKIHKFDKLNNVVEIIENYNTNKEPEEFKFEKDNDYIGVRLDKLEKQFTKFVNILDPLNKKIMKNNDSSEYDERLKLLEEKITNKIDQLITNIASERETMEQKNNIAIEQILESNKNQQQNILNLIHEIEEEKLNIISESSAKTLMENNTKLAELENLIELQSNEIENLLNEKNQFVNEIESVIAAKNETLSENKIDEIHESINQVIHNFNEKIDNLEYNMDRKMSLIDLSTLDMTINENQKEFFNSIESKLTNNYELVKQEFKSDLVHILNNVNQLKENYENAKPENNYDDKFNDLTNQFDQFSFILKNVSEKIVQQDENKSREIDQLVSILNQRFETLVKNLKDENSKSNAWLNKKVNRTSRLLTSKIMSNFNEINNKFANFLEETRQEKMSLDAKHNNTISTIIDANNVNKKEIIERIERLEQENLDLLNEIEAKRVISENNKLRELEDLINSQNLEIELLLSEKNDFVSEIEHVLRNKHDELSNENIEELKASVNDLMKRMDYKIQTLEDNLDVKMQNINLEISDGHNQNFDEQQFIESLENRLSSNYELIKNEFKTDLIDILNNINQLKDEYSTLKNSKFENGYEEVKEQFDQFRFILKNISEKIIEQDENKSKEIDYLVNTLNNKFETLVKGLRDENSRSNAKLNKKVNRTSRLLTSKIMSNFNEINNKFANFLEETRQEKMSLDAKHNNTISTIIDANNVNKKEIIERIERLEQENLDLLNEIEAKRVISENNKLRELEDLINSQNLEIELLLSEKNDFVSEIEHVLRNKHDELSNENIEELKASVNDLMKRMDYKIQTLEDNLDIKMQNMSIQNQDGFAQSFDEQQFIESLENRLSSNYEVIKNEFKTDLIDILNNINQLKEEYSNLRNLKIENGYEEVKDQFEQFRFLLKNMSEKMIEQDQNKSHEIDQLVSLLNNKFENLVKNLREENSRSNAKLNKKVNRTSRLLTSKIMSNFNEINNKFANFLEETRQEKMSLDAKHNNTISTIIDANNVNKKEIIERIERLEQENLDLLNEIEAKRVISENNKLRELEDLINSQNLEIELLLSEKNDFVSEIEHVLRNKHDELSNENIEELKASVNDLMKRMDYKIQTLEDNLDVKMQNMNIQNQDGFAQSFDEQQFIESLESRLSSNYEVIKNEFKTDLIDILNNINQLKDDYAALKNAKQDNGFEDIKDQFEQFRFLLKNISEKMIEQDQTKSTEVDMLINNLNNQFSTLIENIKIENEKTSKKIINKVNKSNKSLSKKFDKNLIEMNKTFNSFISDIRKENEKLVEISLESMKTIVETNKINKQDIYEIIEQLEMKNFEILSELEARRYEAENIRLKELEKLIDIQNDEIYSLIEEKNEIIEEIENIILENRGAIASYDKNDEMQESLENIILKFDNRINALEQNLNRKIDEIGLNETSSDSMKEQFERIETNLVENYGFLREDIRNIFLDLSHKFQDITNIFNNNPNTDVNEMINSLFNEIKDLKDVSNSLMLEIKENSNAVLRIENVLEKQLSNFIDQQKQTFEDLEKIIVDESGNFGTSEKSSELEKWFTTMKDLIESHSDFVEYLNNKVEDIELAVKQIGSTDANEIKDILANIDDKIARNESAIITLQESAIMSFKDMKIAILDKIENSRDYQMNQDETQQLLSLTGKLNELEDLLLIQEEQTNLLLNEKEELFKKLEDIKTSSPSDQEMNTILSDTMNLEQKLDALYKNVSSNINEIVSLSSNKDLNEIQLIDNTIDDLMSKTNENIKIVNGDDFIQTSNELESQNKITRLSNELIRIQKELEKIDNIDVHENNYKEINERLDSLRSSLLCCDFDLLSIKELSTSYETNEDTITNLESQSLNKEKIKLVDDLINHNKQYLNNILNQKTELVNLLIDDNNNTSNNFIESKASHLVDLLAERLFEKQNNEYHVLNKKIEELRKRLNLFINPNASINNYNILEQIKKLEETIKKSFDSVENKKRQIMNILSNNINENSDDVKNIIDKFEVVKQDIKNEYDAELKQFKNELMSMKENEISEYRKEIKDIEDEIQNLKNNQLTNDEESDKKVLKDFEPLDNLVEELNFEINSFEQEKENLYGQIKDKIEFLNSLDKPEENNLEVVGTVNTSKFKSTLSSEAKQVVEDEFKSFEYEFKKNLSLVKKGLKNIKTIYENEIDNPSWFKTFNEKLETIEQSILSAKEEKDKNLQEKNNNHLKLINDNSNIDDNELLAFVNSQENKRKEIENFYDKLKDLENYWKNR